MVFAFSHDCHLSGWNALLPFLQVIFRKIADVKRERERQRTEVALSIPDDHPVRKLFQRFRQQRDGQTAGESSPCLERNCVQEGPPRPAATQCQPQPEKSEQNCPEDAVRSQQGPCGEKPPSQGVNREAAGGPAARKAGARGWAKFKNATSAAPPPPPPGEDEKPTEKAEGRTKGSRSSEQIAAAKNQAQAGGAGAGADTGAAGALHKTDSCDSGITKSDLRLDKVSDFRLTPQDRSPVQPPETRRSFYPIPEQTLQASLQELKLELKDDLKSLNVRMSGLEVQLAEALQLLKARTPAAGSPQGLFDISRPASPEADKEDIFS